VSRRVLGPNMDEVKGEWRKLHNGALNDLYCSANNIRMIKSRWTLHVACVRERCVKPFGGEPEGKGPLGRLRR
jgi:hypothetical protein